MASKTLKVEIVGDASSLSKAFKSAGSASSGFGSELSKVVKYSAVAVGAAGLGGLAVVLKTGIAEFSQSTKVAAQTNAVLKSTGQAAGVTAKQVDSLANSQLRKTGIDDEAFKTGENMLLTFTNIRNGLGKTNDIYTQAAKVTQDMATAMNGGAIPSSEQMAKQAILVGKALNDPITGMSALHRVGVAFTDDQKKQIQAMEKSGNTMGAQKIILGELNKEFGGSADAIGKTLPGQISILKESFNNLAGNIVQGLVPTFQLIVAWTTAHLPQIQAAFETAFGAMKDVIDVFVAAGKQLLNFYEQHRTAALAVAAVVGALVVVFAGPIVVLAALGVAFIELYKHSEVFRDHVNAAVDAVKDKINQAMPTIKAIISQVVTAAEAIWNRFGSTIIQVATTAVNTLTRVLKDLVGVISGIFNLVGDLIHGRWGKVWGDLGKIASNALDALVTLIKGEVSIVLAEAKAIGKAIIDGIVAGISGLAGTLEDKLKSTVGGALSSVKSAFGIHSPSKTTHDEIGVPLGQGVIEGWLTGTVDLPSKMSTSLQAAVNAGIKVVQAAQTQFQQAFSGFSSIADQMFSGITGSEQTEAGKKLAALTGAHDAADLKDQLAQARAALAQAKATVQGQGASVTPDMSVADQIAMFQQNRDAVVAAQKALNDLLYQQKVAALTKEAAAEQKQLDATNQVRQINFDKALAQLQLHLQKTHASTATAMAAITNLLSSYGVTFASVGRDMGIAWVQALKDAISEAAKSAGSLSTTLQKASDGIKVPVKVKGKASGGPVFGGTPYMVGERGRELFVPTGNGTIVPNHALRNGGGTAGLPAQIMLVMSDGRPLASFIRGENARYAQVNGAV